MKKKGLIIAGAALVLLIAAAAGGIALYRHMQNQVRLALGPLDTGIIIQLSNPPGGSRWPQDTSVPVLTTARSTGILVRQELWLDGVLFQEQDLTSEEPGDTVYTNWRWTAISLGSHLLQARAVDDQGNTAVSGTVRFTVTEPAGYNLLLRCQDGETLAQVIERAGVAPEIVYAANPQIDPQDPEQLCSGILIPQEPPAALDLNTPAALAPPDSGAAEPVVSAGGWSNLNVPVGQQLAPPDSAPAAPQVYAQAAGCEVTLTIQDTSENETGFLIRRIIDGDAFTTETIPLEAHSGTGSLAYTDSQVPGGLVQYTVSAFNAAGSNPSAPAMVELDVDSCGENGINLPGRNDNVFPEISPAVDLAYFYYRTPSGYHRYPADPDEFLAPGQVTGLDLQNLGATLGFEMGTQTMELDLWGWEGEEIDHIGSYTYPDSSTTLRTCPDEKPCYGDSNAVNTVYEGWDTSRLRTIFWTTEGLGWPANNRLLIQLSDEPFDPEILYPSSLLASWTERTYGREYGRFEFDIKPHLPLNYGGEEDYYSYCLGSGCGDNKLLYMRAIPMLFEEIVAPPSNSLFLHVNRLSDEYYDLAPSIYGVEILEYTEPLVPNPAFWGCVFINHDYEHGICPADIEEPSDFEIVTSGIVEGVLDAWSTAIQAIDTAKNFVVDQLVALGDLVYPGWCNDTCRGMLKTGLDLAITALTGLPPNLPNFEEMAEAGIEYVVAVAAEQMGVPCEGECQAIIREGIMEAATAIETSNSGPSCNSEEAARHGKQAWCPSFPPPPEQDPICIWSCGNDLTDQMNDLQGQASGWPEGTVVEPALDGIYSPASILVRVSHYEGGNPSDAGEYFLSFLKRF